MAFLNVKDIQGDFERISYPGQKTKGKRFSIKINEPLKKIIQSFLNNEAKPNDYVFPVLKHSDLEEQHYATIENRRKRLNKNLKEIAKFLLSKNLLFTLHRIAML